MKKIILSLFLAGMMAVTAGCQAENTEIAFSGEDALAYTNAYTEFGVKRTGTQEQIQSADWMAEEMEKMGLAVEKQDINFTRFSYESSGVQVGEQQYEAFPYWFPTPTGEEGVTGELITYGEGIDMNGKVVCYEVPGLASVSDISEIAQAAKDAGAVAIIAGVAQPNGSISAQNAVEDYVQKPQALPAVIVSMPNYQEILSKEGTEATVTLTGTTEENALTQNIIGKIDNQADQWVILSTPISGWFVCNAERGGGVGMFLELADVLSKQNNENVNYMFLATTGHELNFMGAHEAESLLPAPEDTKLWFHMGSGIAANEPIMEGYKYVGCSPELMDVVKGSFTAEDGVTLQEDQEKLVQSELGKIMADGYVTYGFFGANKDFHTPLDNENGVSAEELERLGTKSVEIIESQIMK